MEDLIYSVAECHFSHFLFLSFHPRSFILVPSPQQTPGLVVSV